MKNDHLLCIRLSAMGDVAMTIPVLIALKRRYPEVKVTFLSKPFLEPLFATIEDLDFHAAEVTTRHKGVKGLYRLYRDLKSKNISAVADLHNVIRSRILCGFFGLQSTKVVSIDKGRAEKKAITRGKDKLFVPLKTSTARYAEVFSSLGFPVELQGDEFLEKRKITPEILQKIGAEPQKWLGIAPFAAHAGKMYPLDLMEEVISELNSGSKLKLLLFGGGKEEIDILRNLASKYKNTVLIAGTFSFEEELAIISRLDAMLALDSGNGHLAAVFGVPVVTLWGVTHPYIGFAPYAQPESNQIISDREAFPLIPTSVYGNKFPVGYERVMRSITPGKVVKKVREILG